MKHCRCVGCLFFETYSSEQCQTLMPQGVLLKQRSFVIQEKLKHLLLSQILREATDDASRKSHEK